MIKNNLILIGIVMCLLISNINAQEIIYKKQTLFKLYIKNVETICTDNDSLYISIDRR